MNVEQEENQRVGKQRRECNSPNCFQSLIMFSNYSYTSLKHNTNAEKLKIVCRTFKYYLLLKSVYKWRWVNPFDNNAENAAFKQEQLYKLWTMNAIMLKN